jgi:DNA processing protein
MECFYSIALTQCPGIGHRGAKLLIDELGSAQAVFEHRKEIPDLLPDTSARVCEALECPEALERAKREMEFVEKNHLTCLTLQDEAYPTRLRECVDAPVVLFFKGNCDFNRLHVISMVGTRRASDYGKQFCVDFLHDLAELCPDILVVSGLAYGIDIHAHRAALDNHLATVGVLAHGLDRLYPYHHRQTAVEMLKEGGLLTEFLSETNPDPFNFVCRNRIVAGMTDATIVVESAEKGGSLITADLATGYGKDCFAVPGRVNDAFSKGTNQLIRDNKAALIENAEDFVKAMGWETPNSKPEAVQREMFLDLTPEETQVVDLLRSRGDMQVNALVMLSDIPFSQMTTLLFQLEMKGVVRAMVGGVYRLL